MTAQPLLPKNAPFTPEDIDALNSVVARTTPQQRAWLAGFFAGFEAAQAGGAQPQAAVAAKPRQALTILYASESGNAEALAMRTKKLAQKHGLDAKVVDMADADLAVLSKAKNLIVFASTWGEGDPPSRAVDFYTALMSAEAPRLEGVRFAVLALGDTAYAQFCATGKAIDARLEALGGDARRRPRRSRSRLSQAGAEWTDKALGELAPAEGAGNATVVHVDFKGGAPALDDDEPQFTAENPLRRDLDARQSQRHGLDARDVARRVRRRRAGLLLSAGRRHRRRAGERPATRARAGRGGRPRCRRRLVQKLRERYDVTTLSRALVESYAKLTRAPIWRSCRGRGLRRVRRRPAARRPVRGAIPRSSTPEQLFGLLRPLPGRLYSVASSLKAHPGEAHLLVGAVRWESHGKKRNGVASTYVADRRKRGDAVRVYVKPNRHFRLPADGNRPIIMIGAGTGVAPYPRLRRGARASTAPSGKSWLFFGERNFTNDFLYQLEWQEALEAGALVAHRRRLLARPAGEDLRAAPAVGAPRRPRRLARRRRAPLRLRRREGHGARTSTRRSAASSPRPHAATRKRAAPS